MTKVGPTRESLLARETMMKHRIRALPPAEQLRLAADFFDEGRTRWAWSIARLAVERIAADLAVEEDSVHEPE